MPDRRARFRFEMDKKVDISNKRVLAKLASQHIYESMTYANRALGHIDATIGWFGKLREHEARLAAMNLKMEEDAEDREMLDRTYTALIQAREAVLAIRAKRLDIAAQMEEDFDPIFHPPVEKPKLKKPLKPVPVEGTPVAPPIPPPIPPSNPPVTRPPKSAAPAGTVAPAVSTVPAAPSVPAVKLDSRLIARMKRERARVAEQDARKQLSGPSIGTDTNGD